MTDTYERARRYARKCDAEMGDDLVHEAWLSHYHRTGGQNLFDCHEYYVIKAIKWLHLQPARTALRPPRFTLLNGERIPLLFVDLSPILVEQGSGPFRQLVVSDMYENISKAIANYKTKATSGTPIDKARLQAILDMLIEGYSQAEISDKLGVSRQVINYSKSKLKSITTNMNSPFNGSTLVPNEILTSKEWNERQDKDQYEMDGYCQNEYKVLYIHRDTKNVIQVTIASESKINEYVKRAVKNGN